MGRVFQGASTVNAILETDLIEQAAEAGMRSVFIGLETLNPENLRRHAKHQNLARDYDQVIRRVHSLGIMVNASFVFGLDDDDADVFDRTVEWATSRSVETATFHIMTPYPGTALHTRLVAEGRITDTNWSTTTPAMSSISRAACGPCSSLLATAAPTVTSTAGARSLEGPQASRPPGRPHGIWPTPVAGSGWSRCGIW